MSLAWVSVIKNETGEYHFCVPPTLPNITSIAVGANSYSFGGYRESNSEGGSSANFIAARAACKKMMEDAAADPLIWDGIAQGGLDTWVYGKSGGTGIHFVMPRVGTTFKNFNLTKYLSFSNSYSYQPSFSAGSYDNGGNYYYSFAGLALLYDDVLNVIAPVFVSGNCSWYNNNHNPNYYDSARYFFEVFAGMADPDYTYKNNFYPILFTSIPSGGGGSGPYDQGGTSTPGGGENATYDDTSDYIDVPGIPLLNLTFSGFMSAYAPTLTQVQDLATFVWSDWDAGNYLNKLFANVADAIISLHMLPFSPSASTTPADVMVGKYDSGVDMYPLNAQFNDVTCGSVHVPLYWDNYLDYNPYTKLTLFLPYVGEVTLNPDEVMDHDLSILYRVDALTGAFVCFMTREDHKIIGQYQGNCALSVPLSSANYAQLHAAMLTIASAAVGAAAATGGAVAGLAAGGGAGIEAALGVMDTKVKHNVSGALGSAAGFMGSQKPYLIIERARQCLPEDLGKYAGYPSQITAELGSLTGYTEVSDIILDDLPLTEQELEELRGILAGGVIL